MAVACSPLSRLRPCLQLLRAPRCTPLSSSASVSRTGWRPISSSAARPPRRIINYILLFGFTSISAYTGWIYHQSQVTWPKPLRGLLRDALKRQGHGELEQSEQLFSQALQLAQSPDLRSQLDELKISGIAISLASVLEQARQPQQALKIYDDAFKSVSKALNTAKRDQNLIMRAVALAQRVGRLAADQGDDELAEKRMSWAVSRMLKILVDKREEQPADQVLELPDFITKTDLGASMEDLGLFYLEKGNKEYATPLLFRALTMLLPSGQKPGSAGAPSLSDRCHGATIANNLSSAFALPPSEPDQSTVWAENALFIANAALKEANAQDDQQLDECKSCRAVAHFNRAVVREEEGKIRLAREDYQTSLDFSRELQYVEGAKQALSGLQRLDQRRAA